jgi:hypothetical protein
VLRDKAPPLFVAATPSHSLLRLLVWRILHIETLYNTAVFGVVPPEA